MKSITILFIAMIFTILYSLFYEVFCLEPYTHTMLLLCILTFDIGRLHERLDKVEGKKNE